MDSSDFLRQILFQPYLVKKTPYVRRTSPGTRMFLLTIYLPWLLNMLPYSYWALTCNAALPTYSAFMISVRQASDLPPASFRFPVTRDTLALGYILPAVGRIRDFHPLKHAPAGRTLKKASPIGETFLFVLALPIFPASHPASIVGADELNFCVRDGNRWTLIAINTNLFRRASL